ncbi:dipeptidase PepE [Aureibacter tunicatorum]|uniref:Dipeptidase E n=1 Tax=Aureibacter tunicatorum TaxID=866807 RepID=A0AAE3XKL6_9BACT|nr:dipeptidase PepE [Aureibacter tunicatorum]MDR6239556.1 dipeptidase E [Aureibacter tunicatorum]BDD04033.1 peptidase E [Aureibacter tunicatorum]
MKKILLLSNSTLPNEPYLDWAIDKIKSFLGHKEHIIFIPYAGVTISYDEYTERLNSALERIGLKARGIHEFDNKEACLKQADAILVGGGNTFELLHQLYANNLMNIIRDKVNTGTEYIGWSAGSNVATLSIKTTNDMPITYPESFDALRLVNFQINPHYTEKVIPDHGGESRKQRLQEYLTINNDAKVICIPEGTYIEVNHDKTTYHGREEGKILCNCGEIKEFSIQPGESIK